MPNDSCTPHIWSNFGLGISILILELRKDCVSSFYFVYDSPIEGVGCGFLSVMAKLTKLT